MSKEHYDAKVNTLEALTPEAGVKTNNACEI